MAYDWEGARSILAVVGLTTRIVVTQNADVSLQGHRMLSECESRRMSLAPGTNADTFAILPSDEGWVVSVELGDFDDFRIPVATLDDAVETVLARFNTSFTFGQESSITIEDAIGKLRQRIPAVYQRNRKGGGIYIEGGAETDSIDTPLRFRNRFEIGLEGALYLSCILWFPPSYKRTCWTSRTLLEAVQTISMNWTVPQDDK